MRIHFCCFLLIIIPLSTLKANNLSGKPLTPAQVENLSLLCKTWGFIKYYNFNQNAVKRNWDSVLVNILKQNSFSDQSSVINLGEFMNAKRCKICPGQNEVLRFLNNQSWIELLPISTKSMARELVKNFDGSNHYFVVPSYAMQPRFTHERSYRDNKFPSWEYRILGLFRYWNSINYFYPNLHLVDSWDSVLTYFIPRFYDVSNVIEYQKVILELSTQIKDSHALPFNFDIDELFGSFTLPFLVNEVEGQYIVGHMLTSNSVVAGDLELGDIIESINGIPVVKIVQNLWKYTPSSNEQAGKLIMLSRYLTRQRDSTATLQVIKNGRRTSITVVNARAKDYSKVSNDFILGYNTSDSLNHEGSMWRKYDSIGYVHLGNLKEKHINRMLNELNTTKAIIFDLRTYPHYIIRQLLPHFVDRTIFACFRIPNYNMPGLFIGGDIAADTLCMRSSPEGLIYPKYQGKVGILVDERTYSLGEFFGMALQQIPKCLTIGSQTSGADGDVSSIVFPGGYVLNHSGVGVNYPNGEQTQRTGIKVDIIVKPTIKGIKEGKDEVLEFALNYF